MKESLRAVARSPVFWITTGIPTLATLCYFGLIASDIYVSESEFVIRGPSESRASGFAALISGLGQGGSDDDAYLVQNYMQSRDALDALDRSLKIADKFRDPGVDTLSRFPGIRFWNRSRENLYLYFKDMVSVEFDSTTGVTSVRTRAFTAEDALKFNQGLLGFSEGLVNSLNARSREDSIRTALDEFEIAQRRHKDAMASIAAYRVGTGMLDPQKQAELGLQDLDRLRHELLMLQEQIARIEGVAPNNPQLEVLRHEQKMLEDQISAINASISGKGQSSFARQAAEYERLVAEGEISAKILDSAAASLEQARIEARRKERYLDTIVQPGRPDYPVEPRRVRIIVSTFLFGCVLWAVVSLLLASVAEHTE